MKQRIQHGIEIDFLTADELVKLLPRKPHITRMRAAQSVTLDAAGTNIGNTLIIYKCPVGSWFSIRRVQFELSNVGMTNMNTGTIGLGGAPPIAARYFRSDTPMGFCMPARPGASTPGIPGVETWGDQQGPFIANGETFGVQVALGATLAGVTMTVMVEGLLTQNPED